MSNKSTKALFLALLMVMSNSCDKKRGKESFIISSADSNSIETKLESSEVKKMADSSINSIDTILLEESIGVLLVGDKYSKRDTIFLQNEDGSIWHKLTFFYDDTDGEFEYTHDDFLPYAFNPDYFFLCMRVLEIGKRYKVVVNEEKIIYKYVAYEGFWEFHLWEEYVLNAFRVESKQNKYDIHAHPSISSEIRKRVDNRSIIFSPIQILDEWLKVEWEDPSGASLDGWIRWRIDNKLIVEILPYA